MKYINELVIDGKGLVGIGMIISFFEIMNISVMSAELKRENKKGKKKGSVSAPSCAQSEPASFLLL
ncbi:hypothetical protein [uncultured Ruminobacter sp.]|uniref:hypothetical protein n=1 Tax=uncultured Ruminobacter sp. TaxID=538947 RepID=UPI00260E996D|nr:hypothetical protein [uncultured Ruminobacter sp.]